MFSQVFFIMGEDKEIGAYDALVKSMHMMKGYKWKFFRIILRLMGLVILCIFTLGIGFIWLMPYQNVVYAKFYDDIKANMRGASFKNNSGPSDLAKIPSIKLTIMCNVKQLIIYLYI